MRHNNRHAWIKWLLSPIYSNPLSSLRWHRLTAELINIRSVSAMSAHTLSVFQAIIKGVTAFTASDEKPLIFFHIKDKKHTFRIREGSRTSLEIFFCRQDYAYISQWRETFKTYLTDPLRGGDGEKKC
jgi:hypothetical protein